MDVRCEKCQTEYELDEARLKPGGVTVKCTNCGHMFKIRKRSPTNVGAPPAAPPDNRVRPSSRPPANASPPPARPANPSPAHGLPRADSILDDAPTKHLTDEGPTTVERQWLIRLENGDQKQCRELATLQQWIVAGVVSRESLISRTGKTWKRLGDIAELASYFDIADEARTTREDKKTAPPPARPAQPPVTRGTMLGVSAVSPHVVASAAGGTILPDDEARTTGTYRSRAGTPPPPPPRSTKTPPMGSPAPAPSIVHPPMASTAMQPAPPELAQRRPITQPPPPPPRRDPTPPPIPPKPAPSVPPPPGGRATAMWATNAESAPTVPGGAAATGAWGGKISAVADEPAFAAGRVRLAPGDEASFETGKVRAPLDDDDDMMPARRGSRAGLIVLLMVLLVGGAAATIVYLFVLKKDKETPVATTRTPDAAQVADKTPDAAPIISPIIDAAPTGDPKKDAIAAGQKELLRDDEAKLRQALTAVATNDDPDALALRGQLGAALVQDLRDRSTLISDRNEIDKLRKDADKLLIDAATAAQKAQKASPNDAAANIALAAVLRLQRKPIPSFQRFVDTARAAKPAPDVLREIALGEALALAEAGRLDEAKAAFAAIDKDDNALEKSGDVRARFHLALIALAQQKAADAKPLVEAVLAATPEHAGARALAAKLETLVAKTDPLPPEDHGSGSSGKGPGSSGSSKTPIDVGTGGNDYDSLMTRANKLAETNCTAAMVLYQKALDQKPSSPEALTGFGYCLLNAKQFASAQSKFRAAISASGGRYEPAIAGVAEGYQQQGLREQAIDAWKAYLDKFPGSQKAKRQLEILGVTTDEPKKPPEGGSSTPPAGSGSAPATPPTPPTNPDPGTGSG